MGIGRMTGRRSDFTQETKSLPEAGGAAPLLDFFRSKGVKGHKNLHKEKAPARLWTGALLFQLSFTPVFLMKFLAWLTMSCSWRSGFMTGLIMVRIALSTSACSGFSSQAFTLAV